MRAAVLSTDSIAIEQSFINDHVPVWERSENMLPAAMLPVKRSFGIVDLWKIRNRKRYFSIYRSRL